MSDVKIQIDNINASGSVDIMNNTNSSNSNVNVQIKDSKLGENSSVMDDLTIKNGRLNVDVNNLDLGANSSFMDNKYIDGKEVNVSYRNGEEASTSSSNIKTSNVSTKMVPVSNHKQNNGIFKKLFALLLKKFNKHNTQNSTQEFSTQYTTHKKSRHDEDYVKALTGYEKCEIDYSIINREDKDDNKSIQTELENEEPTN